MPLLSAVLAPEAVGKLHDAILCLSKFSESVSIEAQHNKVRWTRPSMMFHSILTLGIAGAERVELLQVRLRVIYLGQPVLRQVSSDLEPTGEINVPKYDPRSVYMPALQQGSQLE